MTGDNKADRKPLVGVLAIQGDFEAHISVLKKLGVQSREIRESRDLINITHLIIPGGESTAISLVAKADGYWNKLARFKGPVMGTCMGSILMASEIENPQMEGWGMLDIAIRRNAYGRQVHSFTAFGKVEFSDKPFEMVFIRAPRIINMGKKVKPIAWLNEEITGVISKNKIALTFHPELSDNTGFHEMLLGLK